MFGKGKNTDNSGADSGNVCTLIGPGTIFDGDLASSDTVRIDGVINGNCSCEKKLILSAGGQIKGNITAQSVIISGKVDGDITVKGKVELLSTGKLSGNIVAGSLVIDEGASFEGRCTMSAAASREAAHDTDSEED